MDDAVPDPDVRFSLANERTLLAYQRTGVGLLAAAVASANFVSGAISAALAITFVIAAVVCVAGGYRQYLRTDRAIRRGDPAPRGATAHLLAVGLIVCTLVVAIYVLSPA